jgi:hypothetical protein
MTEVHYLIEELTLAYEGDEKGEGRFAPALRPLLKDVDAQRALVKPIPTAHNIWEIVLHLTGWKEYVADWIEGVYGQPSDERDWPKIIQPDDEGWRAAIIELHAQQMRLIAAAEKIPVAQLHEPPEGRKTTRYAILHGILQHDCYHGGQIAILKKGK